MIYRYQRLDSHIINLGILSLFLSIIALIQGLATPQLIILYNIYLFGGSYSINLLSILFDKDNTYLYNVKLSSVIIFTSFSILVNPEIVFSAYALILFTYWSSISFRYKDYIEQKKKKKSTGYVRKRSLESEISVDIKKLINNLEDENKIRSIYYSNMVRQKIKLINENSKKDTDWRIDKNKKIKSCTSKILKKILLNKEVEKQKDKLKNIYNKRESKGKCFVCGKVDQKDNLKFITKEYANIGWSCRGKHKQETTKENNKQETTKENNKQETTKENNKQETYHRERIILGISEDKNITPELLKQRYRERVKETHPDTDGDKKEFIEVKKAYERLKQHINERKDISKKKTI